MQDQPTDDDDGFNLLCDEAHKNVREDRKSLKEHLKRLDTIVSKDDIGTEVMVLLTDAITKTSEAILKANTQIIQIAQLKLKRAPKIPADSNLLDDSDTNDVYNMIEGDGEAKVKQN